MAQSAISPHFLCTANKATEGLSTHLWTLSLSHSSSSLPLVFVVLLVLLAGEGATVLPDDPLVVGTPRGDMMILSRTVNRPRRRSGEGSEEDAERLADEGSGLARRCEMSCFDGIWLPISPPLARKIRCRWLVATTGDA